MRRSSFTDTPVTYAAVGATQAADLMTYPPVGFKPSQMAALLGSGAERFKTASAQVMTWVVQTNSGFSVEDPSPGTGERYTGVSFDEAGAPHGTPSRSEEQHYAPDGTPFITNGMTATLVGALGPIRVKAPVRVVYVIDEPRRAGFAVGTLAGHPQSGEQSFVVEFRDDDSVWLVLRSFSRPGSGIYRVAAPFLRLEQRRTSLRFLRSLQPGRAG